jgi:hypothetical protein
MKIGMEEYKLSYFLKCLIASYFEIGVNFYLEYSPNEDQVIVFYLKSY